MVEKDFRSMGSGDDPKSERGGDGKGGAKRRHEARKVGENAPMSKHARSG
jgi:hypothetical protein